jgi:hypothetical protein
LNTQQIEPQVEGENCYACGDARITWTQLRPSGTLISACAKHERVALESWKSEVGAFNLFQTGYRSIMI